MKIATKPLDLTGSLRIMKQLLSNVEIDIYQVIYNKFKETEIILSQQYLIQLTQEIVNHYESIIYQDLLLHSRFTNPEYLVKFEFDILKDYQIVCDLLINDHHKTDKIC